MTKCVEFRTRLAGSAAAAAVILCASLATPAAAGEPPLGNRTVNYVAREQPIAAFLQQFFADQNLPVTVDPAVRGTINGPFSGSARRVYADVTRAFDLATYYDGVSVYVYPSSQVGTRVFPVGPEVGARVRSTLSSLRLQDAQNRLQDGENNLLVATGTRRFIQQVEELARAYGASQAVSPTVEYRVFYLRYAWADDITLNNGGRAVQIPGVASILRSLLMREQAGVEAVGRREQFLGSAVPGLRGQGLARQSANQPAANGTLGLTPIDAPGPQTLAPAPTPGVDAPAGGYAPGDAMMMMGVQDVVRVQADSRLNAVIVRDVAERMATYESLIKALDVEPTMLEIEATIIDINTTRLRELGMNFRFDDGDGGVSFRGGDPFGNITRNDRGLVISTVIGNGDTFTARLRALEEKGAARIVSRPQVMTLSNVEAVFDNSRTFYVRVAGEREVDLFNVTAGTALRVTPHVTREAAQTRIRMLVNIEDGTVTDDDVEDIPVVQRAAINTQALIAEGQSLLVGGLTIDQQSNGTTQVPILGDIPLIGNLFRTNSRSEGRIERLFLITPRVANMTPQAPAVGPRLDVPVTPPPPPLPTPSSAPAKVPRGPAKAPVAAATPAPAPAARPTIEAALQPAAAKPMVVKASYALPPSGLEPLVLSAAPAVFRPAPITMAPIPNPVVKRAAFKRTSAKRRAFRNRYRAWTPRS